MCVCVCVSKIDIQYYFIEWMERIILIDLDDDGGGDNAKMFLLLLLRLLFCLDTFVCVCVLFIPQQFSQIVV